MTNQTIENIILKELNDKTFAVTEQYLEIHSPIIVDGKLKIDRIDREKDNGVIIVYLPVDNEPFHFAVYIELESSEIIAFDTQAFHNVYFIATSDSYSLKELTAMTKLISTSSHDIGSKRRRGNSIYEFSSFEICPTPEPDEFEDKLKKLLDVLEEDIDGIKQLVQMTDSCIQVASSFHNGNGMIGGHNIDYVDIKRMNEMNLSINFDIYGSGNKFKELIPLTAVKRQPKLILR